jgi:chorismate mutase
MEGRCVRSVAISVTFESTRRDMIVGFPNQASRIADRFTSIDVVKPVGILVDPRLTDAFDYCILVLIEIRLFVGRGEFDERQLPPDLIVQRAAGAEMAYRRNTASLVGL